MTSPVDFLQAKAKTTEAELHRYIDTWEDVPEILREAVCYSLFAGGKRLRPALVLGTAELVGGDESPALPAAAAIEMIHTYSLIHDDLPAMDNDDLRRGKPTAHRVFGEAVAILAGDALLTMAFDLLASTGNSHVIAEVARAAGAAGMVGGQVLDLQSENKKLPLEKLQHLHASKTGAMITVSVRAGALLGGASEDTLAALTRYGERIGLAFQIADDILDVVGDEVALGKPIGSDEAHNKSTYPALLGLDRAKELAQETVEEAVTALEGFGDEAHTLRQLARYIVDRDS